MSKIVQAFDVGETKTEITLTDTPSTSNNTVMTSSAVMTAVTALVLSGNSARGEYDASTNLFPSTGGSGTSGAINIGDEWVITVAGILGGQAVQYGDFVMSLASSPGQTPANWIILKYGVRSFLGRAGNVVSQIGDYDVSQVTNAVSTTDLTAALATKQNLLGFTPENIANKVTAMTNSATDYACTQLLTTLLAAKQNLLTNPVTGQTSSATNQVALFADATGKAIIPSVANIGVLKLVMGVLTLAVAADYPTLNQNTTGTAANVTGTVAITNGGTGQTTAIAALNALVPTQSGNVSKVLTTDGTNVTWQVPGVVSRGYVVSMAAGVTTANSDVSNGVINTFNTTIAVGTASNISFQITTLGKYMVKFTGSYLHGGGLGGGQGQINPVVVVSGAATLATAGMASISTAFVALGPLPAVSFIRECELVVTTVPCVIKPQVGQIGGNTGNFSLMNYEVRRTS